MVLYLGVDGGGTGCRVAFCDASGRILGQAGGGPSNIASDAETARQNVLNAIQNAQPDGADLREAVTVMGLAGANVAHGIERFREGLPFRRLRIETDATIAVKGALADTDGIVASLGTGSVFASQRAGAMRQLGGWGMVLGDEGSGAWIGRQMLARCLKAADGRVEQTPLIKEITSEFGGADAIVAFARNAQPADFARVAPRVTGSVDPAATAVMQAADGEIASAVEALQLEALLPVTFLGGLGATFAARLSGRWPVGHSRGTALDGALLLARRDG